MAVISLKKIKETVEKSKEVYVLDLGKFIDPMLNGNNLPIKIKTYEETLKLKSAFKMKTEKMSIKFIEFRRAPKSFRDWYGQQIDNNRKEVPTWVQICETSKDFDKIEMLKFRERLFDVIIHIDMDSITEEGKTLWEDIGLSKDDYVGLIELFSNIIKFEEHLVSLEIIIDEIKNGVIDDAVLTAHLFLRRSYASLMKIENKEDRENAIEDFNKMLIENQKQLETLKEKIEEENKENV